MIKLILFTYIPLFFVLNVYHFFEFYRLFLNKKLSFYIYRILHNLYSYLNFQDRFSIANIKKLKSLFNNLFNIFCFSLFLLNLLNIYKIVIILFHSKLYFITYFSSFKLKKLILNKKNVTYIL